MKKRLNILISGCVQGVGFRFATTVKAKALNLTGWVRNKRDNQVEIMAEGEEYDLQQLLNWVHHGPETAKINSVQDKWSEFKNEFNDFQTKSSKPNNL